VIPANSGIFFQVQLRKMAEIPAFAGMTNKLAEIPAFAGMTFLKVFTQSYSQE
jgi:hypothetical protein